MVSPTSLMPLVPPLEQAAAQIAELGQREIALLERRRAKLAEAADAERLAGECLLDASADSAEPDAALEHCLRVKAEARALEHAIDASHRRRCAAVGRKRALEATELRSQSEGLKDEVKHIENGVAKHLSAIAEIEGVEIPMGLLSLAPSFGKQLRSAQLRGEVLELESRAARLESEGIPRSGVIEGPQDPATSNEPMLEQLLQFEGEIPAIAAVFDWLHGCEQTAGQPFGDAPRRYRLAWRDGRIDRSRSYIQAESLAVPLTDWNTGREYPNMDGAKFRAADGGSSRTAS
jgi:hypothetical protein